MRHSARTTSGLNLGAGDGRSSLRHLTFLFTNVEGSTRRWQQDPIVMAQSVAWLLALLGGTVEAHEGVHFATVSAAVPTSDPTARRPSRGQPARPGFGRTPRIDPAVSREIGKNYG
jgi:class 3 adenylate cyclase